MKKMISSALVFGVVFSTLMVRGAVAGETAGQVPAKLDKLSPKEREKALIEGAKKEGVGLLPVTIRIVVEN